MSSFQTKWRNALSAVLPDVGEKEKQSTLSPPNVNTQPCTPTTPTDRSPRPTLSPKDTLRIGEYNVSIDAFLQYYPKLEDRYVESYQVTAQKYPRNGHESKKTCTLRKIPSASAALKRACEHEQLILTALTQSKHPNVIPLLDCTFSDRSEPTNPSCWDIFYLFSDLEIVNLSRMVSEHHKSKTSIPEEDIIRIAIDLVDTLAFLHASVPPLLHRNIRPSGVIRTSFGAFKFLGFMSAALSTVSEQSYNIHQRVKLDMECYTDPKYRSPEMTKRHDCSGRETTMYTTESDVWSMGILLYTMCYHRHPFQGKHGGDILEARIPQHDRGAYPRVEGFIDQILQKNPKARPTAKELQRSLRRALGVHAPVQLCEVPPLFFSSKTREHFAIPRQSYKLTDNIGKETPFMKPFQTLPSPAEHHSSKGLAHGDSVSRRNRAIIDDKQEGDTSHLDHIATLSPPLSSRHSRSKSASPRLVATGFNRIQFPDGKDGLINIPSILVSPSDEAHPVECIPELLTPALLVPVGRMMEPGHTRPLQSPELRRERSQSGRRLIRSQSAGSQPRPHLVPKTDGMPRMSEGGDSAYHSGGSSPSTPRRQPPDLPPILGLSIRLEDTDPGSKLDAPRALSQKPLSLETQCIHDNPELQTDAKKSDEDQEQAGRAETPSSDDIGHLVTITSSTAVFVTGRFGDIFEGNHEIVGKVALKRPRMGASSKEKDEIRRFEREGATWRRLDHPHILKFLGTFKRKGHLYFVSPFIKNGTLLDYVEERPDINRVRLLCETANAINYLHENEVVHGDIKASNMLINDEEHVLLCDFGLTKLLHSRTSTAMKGAGTVRWQSPELWDDAPKTFESDVYAFGMTIAEVITGDPPFFNLKNEVAFIMAVRERNERPEKVPTEFNGISYVNAWGVAEACWKTRPEDRISISEAFSRLRDDPSLV